VPRPIARPGRVSGAGRARRFLAPLVFALLVFAPLASAAAAQETPPDQLVITGARVYTAPGAGPLERATIVVRDRRIAEVRADSTGQAPKAERTIDADGMVVTAGLWNCHVHFTEPKWVNPDQQAEATLAQHLRDMVTSHGFTSVLDTGSDPVNTLALRRRIEGGIDGPKIVMAGGSFVGKNGSPAYLQVKLPEVTDPETALRLTKEVLAQGAEHIKIFTGSYVGQGPAVLMELPVVQAITAEAHRQGRLVVAHPQTLEGVKLALDGGVDVLAHTAPQGGAWPEAMVEAMVAKGMSVIPTLKLWRYELTRTKVPPIAVDRAQDTAERQLGNFAKTGGKVLFGTDLGYMTDYDPIEEFQRMGEAGLSFDQILAALTTSPVQRLDDPKVRGTVEAGKVADLVVLGSDPAARIEGFADVRYTVRDGRIVYERAQ
jgi:imidazolonepropionase-like amidohydrolase